MSYHMDVVRSLRSDKGKRRASASTEPGTKPPPGPTKKASTRNKTSHKRTTIMSPRAQAPPTDCTVLSSPRLADTTSAPGSLPPSSESSLSAGVGALSLVVSSRTSRLLKELEEASASTSLREIIIPNRKIGNEDAEMLCQALSTHTTMVTRACTNHANLHASPVICKMVASNCSAFTRGAGGVVSRVVSRGCRGGVGSLRGVEEIDDARLRFKCARVDGRKSWTCHPTVFASVPQ